MRKIAGIALVVFISATFAATNSLAFENIAPVDAYNWATSDPNVYILDVRTIAEWSWVGHPGKNKLGEGAELTGKVINISYELEKKGEMVVNPLFLHHVNEIFGSNPDAILIAMCRSGSRSVAAANVLEAAGYQVLNMVTGFEGGGDAKGYRTKNGWKMDGLPYTTSGDGYSFWNK